MIHFTNEHLTVFQSSLYQTTSAVIQTDEVMILTDPNWLPQEVQAIREYVDRELGEKSLYIIYTHSDFDHIIGSGAFPEAKVIASEELKNHEYKNEIVQKIHQFDQRYYIKRDYEPHYPQVDHAISRDGEKLDLGDLSLTFYKAPGHTHDGLFTVVEPLGIFLSGDYLSDVEFPFIFSSYIDYKKTLKKTESILRDHTVHVHVPGHGSVTGDLADVERRIKESTYYVDNLLKDSENVGAFCRERYAFFEGMKNIHSENIETAKKEAEKADQSPDIRSDS
ncbi:MBL fold metallo-hydrolase [Rossellomorea sp. KS-H15a]|uniref:MBL fold metallo-hydrolase n=1 Tax=Rossellomorea sp. KS-H15a TaxID=2963940 RepID=UPI0020C71413|nr:MBL fold metallo-hydrolase [Rossellomorea sp. KS-H15a]UTE78655.1 MBL fold metallo-hydrolase [Rossellomorea sp. KS-H15a]